MPSGCPGDDILRRLLAEARVIAVVGLSPDPSRPSHVVARYLQAQGYRVVPVNPGVDALLGEPCFADLEAAAAALDAPIDIVDVFRRTEHVAPFAEAAVAIGARCLWQQLGIADEASARRVEAAGRVAVVDRCLRIEHMRLLGERIPAGR